MTAEQLTRKQLSLLGTVIVLGLTALSYLDHTFVQAGLWAFVGLTLTSGFLHGALDIVLMQREFANARRLAGVTALYALAVIFVAIVCAGNGWLMLLLLLSMSIWHFGEPYGRWAHDDGVSRVIAGGAPVMLPALLSAPVLQSLLPMAVGIDASWTWTIWQAMAWLWLGASALGVSTFLIRGQRLFCKPLWIEVAFVVVLNLALSPLLAFSIYFGVLHASAHIYRVAAHPSPDAPVERAIRASRGLRRPGVVAVILTCTATIFLLLPLVWYLQSAPMAASTFHGMLNGLLVALTAVTLPHLILVSRNARGLTRTRFALRPKA